MSATCQACRAETRDNSTLCKICYRELLEAVASIRSSLHDLSVLATGQARVTRASGPAKPEPAFVEHDDVPAWLKTRDGAVALPSTRLPINEGAREQLYVGLQTVYVWARHLAEAKGLNLDDELAKMADHEHD